MDQRCDVVAVPVDERRRAALEVRKLDRLPVEIDVDTEVGQPVRELQRGIAQRAGQRVSKVGGRGLGSELEDEVTHGRPGEANVQQRGEEHERGGAERRERRPPDLLDGRPVEGSRHEEAAIITSPSANASSRSTNMGRNGRSVPRLRRRRVAAPIRQ